MAISKLTVTVVMTSSVETELTHTISVTSLTIETAPAAIVKTDSTATEITFAKLQLGCVSRPLKLRNSASVINNSHLIYSSLHVRPSDFIHTMNARVPG